MSIYSTILSFDSEDHADDCERWTEGSGFEHGITVATLRDDGVWHVDSSKPCTCGQGEPYKNPGNIYPPTERAGLFFLNAIPAHIGQDPNEGFDAEGFHPFLQLSLSERDMLYEDGGSGSIILDYKQVQELKKTLSWWLKVVDGD